MEGFKILIFLSCSKKMLRLGKTAHMLYYMCNFQHVHFATSACYNVHSAICIESAIQINLMDQLNRSASQTSWIDQFSIFEALASLYIQRLTFQFVHYRSFTVLQRPCFQMSQSKNIFQKWFSIQNIPMNVTFPITHS